MARSIALLTSLALPHLAPAQQVPQLPDSTGWGVHVLALARGPDSSIWVGTYGRGIFVLRPGASQWEHIRASDDSAAGSISSDFVHAFAFGPNGEIWYGTVGNGWGLSTDGGRTWRNWQGNELGKEWLYVAPNGIVTRGDTIYIATADGIKVTWDNGATWAEITDSAGATRATNVWGRIANQYVLSITAGRDGSIWAGYPKGVARSRDGGRSWEEFPTPDAACYSGPPWCPPPPPNRTRAHFLDVNGLVWLGTEAGIFAFYPDHQPRDIGEPGEILPVPVVQQLVAHEPLRAIAATSAGILRYDSGTFVKVLPGQSDPRRVFASSVAALGDSLFVVGTPVGVWTIDVRRRPFVSEDISWSGTLASPNSPKHTWFRRPIALTDQPYIDQTYRFGSTMGGTFQPHQGVEFNNPDGTPVHAIGDGAVMHAGPAEAGALTVAIRHDRRLTADGARRTLYSVYYHNSRLLVEVGDRVKAGDVIALVGNTGRATNDHLHLEVHALPVDSVQLAVDPAVRYPPHNANPELWIEPLSGTGLVAGQVWDSSGRPVPQARIYGLVKPEPQETPFSFIETYGPRNHSDPVYQEHFAIGDVPPGEYALGVEIEGKKVYRRVRVDAGKLTWVEFRPDAH